MLKTTLLIGALAVIALLRASATDPVKEQLLGKTLDWMRTQAGHEEHSDGNGYYSWSVNSHEGVSIHFDVASKADSIVFTSLSSPFRGFVSVVIAPEYTRHEG
jgi:hypothetical protein